MNNKVKCIFCVVLFIASFGVFKSKLLSNNFEEFVCLFFFLKVQKLQKTYRPAKTTGFGHFVLADD